MKQDGFINHLSKENYYKPFLDPAPNNDRKQKLEATLERAWKNRDFEIDKYWSRATYFWAFIAATFAGFIAISNSTNMDANFKNELAFMVICLGIVFSFSWWRVNLGSKKWQENWEKHIDMLEDYVTGPLYKTILNDSSSSVSKINILVSLFVLFIWIILAVVQSGVIPFFEGKHPEPDLIIIISSIATIAFIITALRFYGPSKKGKPSEFSFNRRPICYHDVTATKQDENKEVESETAKPTPDPKQSSSGK